MQSSSIAIGSNAGISGMGLNSIAIGNNASYTNISGYGGYTLLNATGNALSPIASNSLQIAPIRNLTYDTTNDQILNIILQLMK